MALTKVQPPVTAISEMESGTTDLKILSAGGDFDLNVAGVDVADISSTVFTIDDLVELVARKLTAEAITLATSGGAAGTVETDANKLEIGTTTLNPVDLVMNSISSLVLEVDQKVTLGTVGTDPTDLIDKNYVDTADALAAVITNTAATIGQSGLDDGTNEVIIKWGVIAGAGNPTTVTFAQAYPNALFVVVLTPEDAGTAKSDGWANTTNRSVTAFDIVPADRGGAYAGNWNWIAIGF